MRLPMSSAEAMSAARLSEILPTPMCPHCDGPLDPDASFTSIPGERWVTMAGWEGLYLVSTHGRAYSIRAGRIMDTRYESRGPGRPKVLQWRLHLNRSSPGNHARPVRCATKICESFGTPVGRTEMVLFVNGDDSDVRLENMRVVSKFDQQRGV